MKSLSMRSETSPLCWLSLALWRSSAPAHSLRQPAERARPTHPLCRQGLSNGNALTRLRSAASLQMERSPHRDIDAQRLHQIADLLSQGAHIEIG